MDNELSKSLHPVYISEKGGAIYAADDVFITVIGMAASDVEGVLSLSDLNTGELCVKPTTRNFSKCLRLDFDGDKTSVLIGIVVQAGANLLGVSKNVQQKVLNAVTDIIGSALDTVNIQISDVRSK